MIFGHDGPLAFYLDWAAYLVLGVFFAFLAALLVNTTSHTTNDGKARFFASGSGIPEVKTILSGFVIRGFLGIQTLWVKVVALVLFSLISESGSGFRTDSGATGPVGAHQLLYRKCDVSLES